MLMAHPAVLEKFLEEYEALTAREADHGSPPASQRLQDVAYTLCISTGTRDIDAALIAARQHLARTAVREDARPGR